MWPTDRTLPGLIYDHLNPTMSASLSYLFLQELGNFFEAIGCRGAIEFDKSCIDSLDARRRSDLSPVSPVQSKSDLTFFDLFCELGFTIARLIFS